MLVTQKDTYFMDKQKLHFYPNNTREKTRRLESEKPLALASGFTLVSMQSNNIFFVLKFALRSVFALFALSLSQSAGTHREMCSRVRNTANLISTPHWLVNIATTGTIVSPSVRLLGPNGRLNRIEQPRAREARQRRRDSIRTLEATIGDISTLQNFGYATKL